MLHFLKKYKKKILRVSLGLSAFFAICMFMVSHTFAADGDGNNNLISIGISSGEGSDMASVLQMLLVLTVLSLAPSDRKSTRLNSSHVSESRMPSSA